MSTRLVSRSDFRAAELYLLYDPVSSSALVELNLKEDGRRGFCRATFIFKKNFKCSFCRYKSVEQNFFKQKGLVEDVKNY